ncbi:MAG: peptidase E [Patescibacteria group bacterium]|nr:peptidase E [Patescibacteria group bacterium]
MTEKHIVACSGGFQRSPGGIQFGPIINYILGLSEKDTPKFCYIGTASGDSAEKIAWFYNACIGQNVQPSHLQLFMMPNVSNIREFIMSQDVIWVGGGSVANLLALWRLHGLDSILKEAWERSIILSGSSAGSICWHTGGTTDSFGSELQPVTNGLGLLPFSNGVHYDNEERRRPLFQQLIKDGTLNEGYATDDGVALHYKDQTLHQSISDTPGKYAYHVAKNGDEILETQLETTLFT